MNEENKITKVLYNQVSFVVAIAGVLLSLFFWITSPQNAVQAEVDALQKDVEANKTEYKAQEDFQSQTLIEIKDKVTAIESRQIELLQAVARLEATH
jgi:septal ring factor EnvC (AmiA/AmiB activator)